MKKFFQNKHNRLLLLIVLFGTFLRFFRLESLTTFGGDQGKDYLNVAQMIINHRPTLLGPITHVGVYLGPLYYYLLLPFFIIFNFDPIAAPFMFAIFGSLTLFAIYDLALKFVKPPLARLITLLYAVSPTVIESSRAPSQPHLIPFFATILLISLTNIFTKSFTKLNALIIGISLASIIQFHFLTFPILMISFTVLIINKTQKKYWVWIFLPLFILVLPWIMFELRHQFFITHQILNYLNSGEINLSLIDLLKRSLSLFWFSLNRLLGQENIFITFFLAFFTIVALIKSKSKSKKLLVAYLLLNLVGISLYFNPFDNHYISALYPVIFILIAIGIQEVFKSTFSQVFLLLLIILNLYNYQPFRSNGYTMPKNLNQKTIKQISQIIAQDVNTSEFQVAATLDGDTRAMPYRYVLEGKYNKIPLGVEDYPQAKALYLISNHSGPEAIKNPVWEISSLPNKKLDKTWNINQTIFLHKILSI